MRKFIKILFTSAFLIFFSGILVAYFIGITPISVGLHSKVYKSSNVAMNSYDMVELYHKKKLIIGSSRFSHLEGKMGWFFTSGKNLKRFTKKPKKYRPQFGGYCTFTVSKGYTYPPDINTWHLHNGYLYFFKDEETKKLALEDWQNVLENAKLHWK